MEAKSATCLQNNKIRVLVLGSSNVGKTSLVGRLIQERFCEEFKEKNKIPKRGTFIVELMDTEESLSPCRRNHAIKIAHAYILMYSVDDPASFGTISDMKSEITEIKGIGMPMIIVGNKADLTNRKIKRMTPSSVDNINAGIPHIEVSVYERHNLNGVYRHMFKHPTLQKLIDVVSLLHDSIMSVDDIIGRRLSMCDEPDQKVFELVRRRASCASLSLCKRRGEVGRLQPISNLTKLKEYFRDLISANHSNS